MSDNRDFEWRCARDENNWQLPAKAAWPLRLFGIRHLRCFRLSLLVMRYSAAWASVGIGYGHIAPYDAWVLYAIRRGWC